MKLIPFLGFHGQTHEAMAFYAQALGGQVVSEMKYRDMPPMEGMDSTEGCAGMPPDTLDHVAHSQLEAGGAVLMAADGPAQGEGGGTAGSDATTINIDVDSVEEAERVFKALAAGGEVKMALSETFWAHRWGFLVDRYGKAWMVNCMKQP
jgi:PhnB protein